MEPKSTPRPQLLRRCSSVALEKASWKQPRSEEEIIKTLQLERHPEGGYFRVTWTSDLCSVIDFLMPSGRYAAWHRMQKCEEVWTHHGGNPVILHMIKDGTYSRTILGIEQFSEVVPRGVWQAAEPVGDSYSLVGNTCAPPFDYSDWEMPSKSRMLELFPEHSDIIDCLSRDESIPSLTDESSSETPSFK